MTERAWCQSIASRLARPLEPLSSHLVSSQRIVFGAVERLYNFAMLQFLVSLISTVLHDTAKLFEDTKKWQSTLANTLACFEMLFFFYDECQSGDVDVQSLGTPLWSRQVVSLATMLKVDIFLIFPPGWLYAGECCGDVPRSKLWRKLINNHSKCEDNQLINKEVDIIGVIRMPYCALHRPTQVMAK